MDSILICTHLLVNQKAPCQRSTTCRGIQLCDISSVNKQIQRRYEQPYEFSEFPWHILRHYFPTIRPLNNKKDSKINSSLDRGRSFTKTTTMGISAFNFRFFGGWGWVGEGVCMSLVRISNRVISCFEEQATLLFVTPYLTQLYVICHHFILSYVTGSRPCCLSEFCPNRAPHTCVIEN